MSTRSLGSDVGGEILVTRPEGSNLVARNGWISSEKALVSLVSALVEMLECCSRWPSEMNISFR